MIEINIQGIEARSPGELAARPAVVESPDLPAFAPRPSPRTTAAASRICYQKGPVGTDSEFS